MTEDELRDAMQRQYPTIWGIINQPGVYDILRQAIEGNWPASKTEVALQQSEYFKTTPDTKRQWDILQATDPASAYQRNMDMTRRVVQMVTQLGVKLPGGQPQWDFTQRALEGGWSDNQIRYNLLTLGQPVAGGELATHAADIRSMANDYGVPLSDRSVLDFAGQMAQGSMDPTAMHGYMIEQAKSLYGGNPGMDSALDRGITIRQYTAPYWQMASQELGIDPNTIDLTDDKWNRAIHQVDPTTGVSSAMSLSDWTKTLRSDSVYGWDQTERARTQSAQVTTTLAKLMGAVA